MATIKDVAQSAQVSATTVSRVLNRDDNMSVTPEVRMRIFQAAHALGYVSPRQRRAAAEKTKLIIGVADCASSGRTGPTSAFLLCRAWCR